MARDAVAATLQHATNPAITTASGRNDPADAVAGAKTTNARAPIMAPTPTVVASKPPMARRSPGCWDIVFLWVCGLGAVLEGCGAGRRGCPASGTGTGKVGRA